jgi:hypothetical protein
MAILSKHYPNEDHYFIYGNASTHLLRPADALSVMKMLKNPSKPDSNFGVFVNVIGTDGQPVHGPDAKILKQKICMWNGRFSYGREQVFYYPEGHEKAGLFKGMAAILMERGHNMSKKKAQCGKSFADCLDGGKDCCCQRVLFNEPDFIEEESLLETCCRYRGYEVHFFPKFHCETSFIEQCWGKAKQRYRLLPPSSKEEDLEQNIIACLDDIPFISMWR